MEVLIILNWKQKGAKLLSVFFMGYSGGFVGVLPANYLLDPQNINLFVIFLVPGISGLALLFPQIGKMFGEMANEL